MKYIKLFENIDIPEVLPKVGDYVIIENEYDKSLDIFLSNNIGKIIDIGTSAYRIITVRFEIQLTNNDGRISKLNSIGVYSSEIKYFSPNKENCKAYLNSKRYNL